MSFSDGKCTVTFQRCYSWYEIYVDNALILHHLSETDADEIMRNLRKNKLISPREFSNYLREKKPAQKDKKIQDFA